MQNNRKESRAKLTSYNAQDALCHRSVLAIGLVLRQIYEFCNLKQLKTPLLQEAFRSLHSKALRKCFPSS